MGSMEKAQMYVTEALGRQRADGLVLVVNRHFRGSEFFDWTINQFQPRHGRVLHLAPGLDELRNLLARRRGPMGMNDHTITGIERGAAPQLGPVNLAPFGDFKRWHNLVPRDAFELVTVDGRMSRVSPPLAPHVLALRPFLTLVVLRRMDDAESWVSLGEPIDLRTPS